MKWKQAESTSFGLVKLEDNMTHGTQAKLIPSLEKKNKRNWSFIVVVDCKS